MEVNKVNVSKIGSLANRRIGSASSRVTGGSSARIEIIKQKMNMIDVKNDGIQLLPTAFLFKIL